AERTSGAEQGSEQGSGAGQAGGSEQDAADQNSTDQGSPDQGSTDQGSADQGSTDQGSDAVTAQSTTAEDAATADRQEPDAAEQRFHAVADLPQDENATAEETAAPGTTAAAPSGTAEPTGEDGGETAEQTAEQTAERPGGTGLIAVLLAATVVLAGLASWFGVEAYGAFHGNRALADQATTSEVNGQITDGVEKIFSYDFADTGKTERAAKDLLVGRAIGEYEQLFTTVKQQAPIQKLVVTTTVKASSVNRLEGDRAEVLLFVDQNATRTDIGGEPSVGPAQVVISAERHGDQWKIANISQH
ncbi:hypothetical protein ABZ805_00925, partial [Saccharopolyspora sp. NPDC047091]|uniref:hypothetical protein n=1 Tax=Saccharopolyspora sp. NPDC047091 TaxID=3155924 RepID=UPI0033E6635D